MDQLDQLTGLRTHHVLFSLLEDTMKDRKPAVIIRLAMRNLTRIRMIYGGQTSDSMLRTLADQLRQMTGSSGRW